MSKCTAPSPSLLTSCRPRLVKLTVRLLSVSFRFLRGLSALVVARGLERKGVFATILRSEGLSAVAPSSSESGSGGVGRSDSGRFARAGLLGLCVMTGEGDWDGSFSFDADASSYSISESEHCSHIDCWLSASLGDPDLII